MIRIFKPFVFCIQSLRSERLFFSADAGGNESIVDQVSSRDMVDPRNRDIFGQKSVRILIFVRLFCSFRYSTKWCIFVPMNA